MPLTKFWKQCFIGWLEIINPTRTTFFSLLFGLIGLQWKQPLVSWHSSLSMDSKLSYWFNVRFHPCNLPSNFSQTLPQRKKDFCTWITLTRLGEMLPWPMRHIRNASRPGMINPSKAHVFNEGDLVLTYDQRYDKLGKGKFESMWYGPFLISKC